MTNGAWDVTGATRVVGVFGHPVEHSLSPAMHNAAFRALGLRYIYIPFPVTPENLSTAIRSLPSLGIVGVNLTIPHKEAVLPLLAEITDEARDVGAVNTVHSFDGMLLGDNTDGRGFIEPLKARGITVAGRHVVVLGAGGAARSVVFRLVRESACVTLVNRSRDRAERLRNDVLSAGFSKDSVGVLDFAAETEVKSAITRAALLVNTTRVGMYPEVGGSPLTHAMESALHPALLVYDLIYNPMETQLLREAKSAGCTSLSGIEMLVYQGAASFQRWTGIWPPTEVMEEAVVQGLAQR